MCYASMPCHLLPLAKPPPSGPATSRNLSAISDFCKLICHTPVKQNRPRPPPSGMGPALGRAERGDDRAPDSATVSDLPRGAVDVLQKAGEGYRLPIIQRRFAEMEAERGPDDGSNEGHRLCEATSACRSSRNRCTARSPRGRGSGRGSFVFALYAAARSLPLLPSPSASRSQPSGADRAWRPRRGGSAHGRRHRPRAARSRQDDRAAGHRGAAGVRDPSAGKQGRRLARVRRADWRQSAEGKALV